MQDGHEIVCSEGEAHWRLGCNEEVGRRCFILLPPNKLISTCTELDIARPARHGSIRMRSLTGAIFDLTSDYAKSFLTSSTRDEGGVCRGITAD